MWVDVWISDVENNDFLISEKWTQKEEWGESIIDEETFKRKFFWMMTYFFHVFAYREQATRERKRIQADLNKIDNPFSKFERRSENLPTTKSFQKEFLWKIPNESSRERNLL